MPRILFLFLAGILLTCSRTIPSQSLPKLILNKKPVVKIPEGLSYTFGYLEVPETRDDPRSSSIQLPFYHFKCRGDSCAEDPIIYTVGGPGATTMPSAAYMKYYQYLWDRDVILVEQRGTYYARPHLGCQEWAEAIYQTQFPTVSDREADSLLMAAAIACKDRYRKKRINLSAYRTTNIAQDIIDLMDLLEIEQANLLTISYSTKIAQVLMRDHPERIRSVVMDSPLPLEVSWDEESIQMLMEGYEQLFTACESDSGCSVKYPELRNQFFAALREASSDPVDIAISHEGEPMTFKLTGLDLAFLLAPGSNDEVAGTPRRMSDWLNGDQTSLIGTLESMLSGPGYGDGIGMRISVWCAEEMVFASDEIIAAQTNRYPEFQGAESEIFSREICEYWGVEPAPPIDNQPITSDIPVLLMSGEFDAITPSRWAAAMQANLPNSFHVIFPGWMHSVTTYWSNPCGMEVANAFFNDPSKEPIIDCFGELMSPIWE